MKGTLYVVGTPIGNLNDLSPRGLETLEAVDFIAAEDTRVTLKLLNRFGIKKQMVSYHEHNRLEKGEVIVARIIAGENCALVTDAGMPAVSDPGEELVLQCHLADIPVVSVPGPSALIAALSVAGIPSGRFCFEGFLSMNKKNRKEHLEQLINETRTMIFYEAPHKLTATLRDMYKQWGEREIVCVRELTKIHEQVMRTTLLNAIEYFEQTDPKGEFVLLIRGKAETKEQFPQYSLQQAAAMASDLIAKGELPTKAAKAAASVTGYKKNDIYAMVTSQKRLGDSGENT